MIHTDFVCALADKTAILAWLCTVTIISAAGHGSTMASSVKPVEMMDRSVAVADAEAIGGGDRGADPGLGVAKPDTLF